MTDKEVVEEVEKIIRDAAGRVSLPEDSAEIDEAISQLANALTVKENGLPPSGSG